LGLVSHFVAQCVEFIAYFLHAAVDVDLRIQRAGRSAAFHRFRDQCVNFIFGAVLCALDGLGGGHTTSNGGVWNAHNWTHTLAQAPRQNVWEPHNSVPMELAG